MVKSGKQLFYMNYEFPMALFTVLYPLHKIQNSGIDH